MHSLEHLTHSHSSRLHSFLSLFLTQARLLSTRSPVPNSMDFAMSVAVSFLSRSLISKPYNFYTWHTPNMAGRQLLHLIKYSNRYCSPFRAQTRSSEPNNLLFFSIRKDNFVVFPFDERSLSEFCTRSSAPAATVASRFPRKRDSFS